MSDRPNASSSRDDWQARIPGLLLTVSKPARYLGNEWGAVRRSWDETSVRWALAFPDIYDVGMSHLGSKILYQVINRMPHALCERVYAPAPELEALMRREGIPLFALESRRPLTDFDGIGFSLSYELTYTNLLNMLALSGIPVERSERERSTQSDGRPWPLVFAGGPNAFNPEPFADFVDFVVVGDGEEVVFDLADAFVALKAGGLDRNEFLQGLSKIRGVYVPQFYDCEYEGPGRPIRRWIVADGAPFPVRKNVVRELRADYHPTAAPVPYLPIIHDRVPTEVRRGCDAGCRFCQAGFIYLPVRERKAQEVVDLTSSTIRCTGYEEYSLFSLSSGDYTQSAEVVKPLTEANSPLGASMSLPSLRVDSFSLQMATAAQHLRKSTFTFAPEAGSQRLRDIINKNITEDEIRYAIRETYRAGWQTLKLYFMIGLPGETHEDVAEIVALVDKIKKDCAEIRRQDGAAEGETRPAGRTYPPIRIHLTVSTFVPKPHVPFQWRAQDGLADVAAKQAFLFAEMKKRGVKVSAHDRFTSELEAVLSRGDRRVGRMVKRAWELGAAHDAWSEHHRPDLWRQAAQETGIDFEFYAHGRWSYDWILPWDVIDSGVDKRHNKYDDEQSERCITMDHCTRKCWGCGVCFKFDTGHDLAGTALPKIDCSAPPAPPDWEISSHHPPHDKVQRLRCRFIKDGDLRFISHLDLMRLFERALRRAALPVAFSSGFNPHPALEFAAPLALGVTSEAELVDIYLGEAVDPAAFCRRLNSALPDEARILECRELAIGGPSLMALVDEASYRVRLASPVSHDLWREFTARQEIPFVKSGKTGRRTVDLRPLIRAVLLEDDRTVRLRLAAGSRGNAKPDDVISAMGDFLGQDLRSIAIRRLDLLVLDGPTLALVDGGAAAGGHGDEWRGEDASGDAVLSSAES